VTRRHLRLAAAATAFLLPALVLAQWNTAGDAGTDSKTSARLAQTLGSWQADADVALESDVLALIEPDAYLMRRYQAPGLTPAWIYAGIYRGRANYIKSAHEPEVCYPAQGWEIVHSQSQQIGVSTTESFPATLLHVQRGNEKEVVLYWFQPARRWPERGALEQLFRVFDAVVGRPEYAFVRLSAPAAPGEDSTRDLLELAGEAADEIRRMVERVSGEA